jgi:hypothetical protein
MAWSSLPHRRHTCALIAAAAIVSPTILPAVALAQPTPISDAKASLADADKAAKAKDWSSAVRLYDAANKASPSSEALDGLANAQYQGGQLGEAHASYTEWLDKYGAKAPAGKKLAVETRVKELVGKTGALTVTVNEAGAAISVDDRQVGVSPLPATLRLSPGPHRLRVTKEGFLPADQAPSISVGSTGSVQFELAPASSKGKLVVKEKTGKAIRVTVDGVDMGDAPWTGDVEAGHHDVAGRGVGLATAPEKVTIERGKTKEIELVASSSAASVKIGTSDGKGLIYLDGKLVGEGSFIGDVPSGPHKLRITRDGYDPFEEEIDVKANAPYARTITLSLSSKIETGPVQNIERLEGVYGGFTLLGLFAPGGTGNSVQQVCSSKPAELNSCNIGGDQGGGIGGFIGYHWDPVGMELFVGGQYDQMTMKADWNAASTDPGIGPDPARIENYTLRRAGGMALARIRATKQWTKIRLSLAAGAGVSYRLMFLERDTTAKDSSGARDVFVPNPVSYFSPIVAFEPSVMYRLSPGVAVALGMQLFLDAPTTSLFGGQTPKTDAEGIHVLASQPVPRGLTTRSYELASDIQVFIGPFVGMMFGP